MRDLNRPILTAALVALLLLLAAAPLAAAGGSSSSPSTGATSDASAEATKSPEQMAADHYNAGLRHRDKAWKLEEKAAAASGGERDKLLAKAQTQFEKAIERQLKATQLNPRMHQAHSSLGYALRRTGKYDSSLRAYDKALALAPNYSEAIEYRAEAYLGLNRLDAAKKSYMFLFNNDRPRADELLAAMQKWVEAKRQDPGDVDGATIDAFADWVAERGEVSSQVESEQDAAEGTWRD